MEAISKIDQTADPVGIDENNNGIRDSVETFIDDFIFAPDVNAFGRTYIQKHQMSLDLNKVQADQRLQLLKDIQLIENCTPYLKTYMDKNMPFRANSTFVVDSISYNMHFATQLSFEHLNQLIKHNELVMVNTPERVALKEASVKLAKEYKVGNVFKGYRGDQAKTGYCVSVFGNLFDMSGYVR